MNTHHLHIGAEPDCLPHASARLFEIEIGLRRVLDLEALETPEDKQEIPSGILAQDEGMGWARGGRGSGGRKEEGGWKALPGRISQTVRNFQRICGYCWAVGGCGRV